MPEETIESLKAIIADLEKQLEDAEGEIRDGERELDRMVEKLEDYELNSPAQSFAHRWCVLRKGNVCRDSSQDGWFATFAQSGKTFTGSGPTELDAIMCAEENKTLYES